MKSEPLPRDDWQWLADQLRAWPLKRVHPDRTMCEATLRPMAADVIEAALVQLADAAEEIERLRALTNDAPVERLVEAIRVRLLPFEESTADRRYNEAIRDAINIAHRSASKSENSDA